MKLGPFNFLVRGKVMKRLKRENWLKETKEMLPHPDRSDVAVLACKRCGGTHFIVGQGEYLTAVQCTECLRTVTVHEG